eukprot:CCRYP_005583-RA/>CCRYP_005583-RA protein AED:0.35 eAED:0.35 QI:0/-1/0/1/-1/0/1/0/39
MRFVSIKKPQKLQFANYHSRTLLKLHSYSREICVTQPLH